MDTLDRTISNSQKLQGYDHKVVEKKWQKAWEDAKIDQTDLHGTEGTGKPLYNLMMFPYPSAEGLHVGNMYAFTGSDIYGRFKRMQGYEVFEPIGLDGFGIHSENYAFKIGKHPMDLAQITKKHFYEQLKSIGAMYDWTRTVETFDPLYYRWTQWIFIQMFKHGLAYRQKAEVNFCPSCKTVLSDEQVIDGLCERCGSNIDKRLLEQWFFKITAYAEKLLENTFSLDWTEKVLIAQRQWIGKKKGINITYKVKDSELEIVCFTTTPVNWATTYIVLSPEHPFVLKITKSDRLRGVKAYIDTAKKKNQPERADEKKEKTGVFTGSYCINHVTGEAIPVWVSDFVLMGVGTGAIQACPGHDIRDFEFAKKFGIPIVRVVVGKDGDTSPIDTREQVIEHGPGKMMNSGILNGMEFDDAMEKTMDYFEKNGWGKRVVTYHLRDWLISRQRYWGPPIPMIYCEHCEGAGRGERPDMPGWWSVPENSLPVELPYIDDYKPGDDGIAPLAKYKEFYNVACPECGSTARRETDVSDTFLDSSWYFLRYPSAASAASGQVPFDPEITKNWLPVSMYTGGAEHSVLHLMYSRFVWMCLRDWGYLDFSAKGGSASGWDEPFPHFYAHGLIIKDGAKMSKSKGNVVNPDQYIQLYGADALRLYLMFTGPFDQGGDFRDSAMEGMSRWVGRIWRIATNSIPTINPSASLRTSSQKSHPKADQPMAENRVLQRALHALIKKVTEDIEKRRYNTAIAAMMEFTNLVGRDTASTKTLDYDSLKTFLLLLAPFAPFLAEELYQQLNFQESAVRRQGSSFKSIHKEAWPVYDPKFLTEETVNIVVQVNGKLRDSIVVPTAISKNQKEVETLSRASTKVASFLAGKSIKNVISVPGRLINFVTL